MEGGQGCAPSRRFVPLAEMFGLRGVTCAAALRAGRTKHAVDSYAEVPPSIAKEIIANGTSE